jgi:hypothetical protein
MSNIVRDIKRPKAKHFIKGLPTIVRQPLKVVGPSRPQQQTTNDRYTNIVPRSLYKHFYKGK